MSDVDPEEAPEAGEGAEVVYPGTGAEDEAGEESDEDRERRERGDE